MTDSNRTSPSPLPSAVSHARSGCGIKPKTFQPGGKASFRYRLNEDARVKIKSDGVGSLAAHNATEIKFAIAK